MINVELNDVKCVFEIDSGSHKSFISYSDAKRVGCNIVPSNDKVLGYSGAEIKILGEIDVKVLCNDSILNHSFLVVPCNKTNLLGRDLCVKLGLQFSTIQASVNKVEQDILATFQGYLSPNFVSDVKETVNLEIEPNATPVFVRARPVPLKLKDKVKDEIKRLENEGKISKVFNSEWASPTVNVLKSDGSIQCKNNIN